MTHTALKSNLIRRFFGKERDPAWDPAWLYSAHGLIWLMKFDSQGLIVLEIRDPARRTVSFACVDPQDGKPLWENLTLEEPWWTGVEDAVDGILYLHGYRKPDMPQHLGVFAYDLASGALLWENRDVAFQIAYGGLVHVSMPGFERQQYLKLDARTGKALSTPKSDVTELHAIRELANRDERFRDFKYPQHFDESHVLSTSHAAIIESIIHLDRARGNVDVLEIQPIVIVSWFQIDHVDEQQPQQNLSQHLVLWHNDLERVVYSDRINTGLTVPGMDSFFVKDSQLFYLKHDTQLIAHSIQTRV